LRLVDTSEGDIRMTGDAVRQTLGVQDFSEFLRPRSPIEGYRVIKKDGQSVIEFEGERNKVLNYLFVGVVDYLIGESHPKEPTKLQLH
jgi:hypothetical protein